MPRKNELAELEAMGVHPVHTTGYGNCLFHALSDQLHGDQSQHAEYRATTIQYMRDHPSRFKDFLHVHPGGGRRRNPKRKNPGALGKPVEPGPTSDEVETAFQKYLDDMQKGGEYGDSLGIVAFANAYKVNVYVWSEEMKKFVPHRCEEKSQTAVKKLYIVHHTHEHFSSIRNNAGPHTGPANVICDHVSLADEVTVEGEPTESPYSQAWMIDSIQGALPYAATREAIREALEAYKGNMNKAVSALMPASSSSSSRSSSIERDGDPDDDIDPKPAKKIDRRSSRPQPLHLGKSNKILTVNSSTSHSSSPDPGQLSSALSKLTGDDAEDPDETDEENWRNESSNQASGTTSVSTSASDSSAASKGSTGSKFQRLKLSAPRKPVEKAHPPAAPRSERSPGGEYDADEEEPQSPEVVAKPRRRLITGAERERQRAEKARKASCRTSLSPTSANAKKSSPSPLATGHGVKDLSLRLSPTGPTGLSS